MWFWLKICIRQAFLPFEGEEKATQPALGLLSALAVVDFSLLMALTTTLALKHQITVSDKIREPPHGHTS